MVSRSERGHARAAAGGGGRGTRRERGALEGVGGHAELLEGRSGRRPGRVASGPRTTGMAGPRLRLFMAPRLRSPGRGPRLWRGGCAPPTQEDARRYLRKKGVTFNKIGYLQLEQNVEVYSYSPHTPSSCTFE
jgi:hypothetical protein